MLRGSCWIDLIPLVKNRRNVYRVKGARTAHAIIQKTALMGAQVNTDQGDNRAHRCDPSDRERGAGDPSARGIL